MKEKNREIFIEADTIILNFSMTEDDPDTKAASALISHAMNLGHDGDIENKCVRAFALGMAFERIGGEE
jgi:hypothetical protein